MKYLFDSWSTLRILLFLNLFVESLCDLKFAGWAKTCQIPEGDDLVEPRFECDSARGLSCQVYTQGKLCGCNVPLSYDRRSEECRRKVASTCHIIDSDEEYNRQPFNRKCHQNAECVLYGGTLVGGKSSEDRKKAQEAKPMCLCKPGFVASSDLNECRDPNGSIVIQPSALFLMLTFAINRLFF